MISAWLYVCVYACFFAGFFAINFKMNRFFCFIYFHDALGYFYLLKISIPYFFFFFLSILIKSGDADTIGLVGPDIHLMVELLVNRQRYPDFWKTYLFLWGIESHWCSKLMQQLIHYFIITKMDGLFVSMKFWKTRKNFLQLSFDNN